MYQAFEEYLADKYITKEEILDILCNVMDKSRMLKDSVIALDGFTRIYACSEQGAGGNAASLSEGDDYCHDG